MCRHGVDCDQQVQRRHPPRGFVKIVRADIAQPVVRFVRPAVLLQAAPGHVLDVQKGKVLFSRKGLRGEGEYAERADADGRRLAIEKIVNDIVEGAQSQW